MQTDETADRELLELAEETARVAKLVDDPIISERLHEIAVEVRRMGRAAGWVFAGVTRL